MGRGARTEGEFGGGHDGVEDDESGPPPVSEVVVEDFSIFLKYPGRTFSLREVFVD